jgi:hypothetical protein
LFLQSVGNSLLRFNQPPTMWQWRSSAGGLPPLMTSRLRNGYSLDVAGDFQVDRESQAPQNYVDESIRRSSYA